MRHSAALVIVSLGILTVSGVPARVAERSGAIEQSRGARADTTTPHRIVSLVPALTEILFAIGAGAQVVGVSSFDTFPPEVEDLPRVGALLDPDTERILALRPTLVTTYGSQAEAEARFARAGIRVYSYRHEGVAGVMDTIRELGALSGHPADAERLVARLDAQLDGVRDRVRGLPRPRTVLVMDRQPNTLRGLLASGGVGFLHDILEIAGGENVFADVARESVQPSHETLLREAPEVVLEVRAAAVRTPAALREMETAWAQLASVPAVRNRRIHLLTGQHLVVPGPRLGAAADAMAAALHGGAR